MEADLVYKSSECVLVRQKKLNISKFIYLEHLFTHPVVSYFDCEVRGQQTVPYSEITVDGKKTYQCPQSQTNESQINPKHKIFSTFFTMRKTLQFLGPGFLELV